MKRSRWFALLFLIVALVAMLAVGLYLSATRQEARPIDNTSSDNTSP